MSNKPNPVAETALMLMERDNAREDLQQPLSRHELAALASDIHRLAPGCQRIAVHVCNSPSWSEARAIANGDEKRDPSSDQAASCLRIIRRIAKSLAKLNERLAPLSLKVTDHGDPRGCVLKLESTDPSRPVPRNSMDDAWAVG